MKGHYSSSKKLTKERKKNIERERTFMIVKKKRKGERDEILQLEEKNKPDKGRN